MVPFLPELDRLGYTYCFLYTITNYPGDIEPGSPDVIKTTQLFNELSQLLGKNRVVWRYDPLILDDRQLSISWHKENFRYLTGLLSGATEKVIVSIIDPYKQTKTGLGNGTTNVSYHPDDYFELLEWMSELADQEGLIMQSCAESMIRAPKVEMGACIDAYLMEKLSGKKTSKAKHTQRKGCLCHRSIDIGAYNTCIFGCKYCYATKDHELAKRNYQQHQPDAPYIV